MRPIITDGVGWSVCLLVGWSVTILSLAKTAEPIKMQFRMWTQVGPRNHVLDGNPDPLREGPILRWKRYLHSKWLAERAKSTILL